MSGLYLRGVEFLGFQSPFPLSAVMGEMELAVSVELEAKPAARVSSHVEEKSSSASGWIQPISPLRVCVPGVGGRCPRGRGPHRECQEAKQEP